MTLPPIVKPQSPEEDYIVAALREHADKLFANIENTVKEFRLLIRSGSWRLKADVTLMSLMQQDTWSIAVTTQNAFLTMRRKEEARQLDRLSEMELEILCEWYGVQS